MPVHYFRITFMHWLIQFSKKQIIHTLFWCEAIWNCPSRDYLCWLSGFLCARLSWSIPERVHAWTEKYEMGTLECKLNFGFVKESIQRNMYMGIVWKLSLQVAYEIDFVYGYAEIEKVSLKFSFEIDIVCKR